MPRRLRTGLVILGSVAAALALGAGSGTCVAQTGSPPVSGSTPAPAGQPTESGQYNWNEHRFFSVPPGTVPSQSYSQTTGLFLQQRVSNLFAGQVAIDPNIANPVGNDPAVLERGRQHFIQFNCVGCHAPNGGGGEGPSLSNNHWIYGRSPANIYLSIVHGRPNGMPAWGSVLPEQFVWELAAYIESISEPPDGHKGKTISRTAPTSQIEQVPAEMIQTIKPWAYTESFSGGMRPEPQGGSKAPGATD